MEVNKLILGDNLEILKTIESDTIDLIYLDPPFFSNRNYEVIWGDEGEVRSFQDRWSGGMDHYIAWLKERVEQMHRILKPTGSIFLHCDWHADAYIRTMILDKIFGYENFRNEIIWHYGARLMHNNRKINCKKDCIFFYAKSEKVSIKSPVTEWTKEEFIKTKRQAVHTDQDGREYIWQDAGKGKSKAYKRYIDEVLEKGKAVDDIWAIPILTSSDKERIGYPTQKPEILLKRIVEMASNEGEIVLDPFVGGGTTIAVADKLNRKWIGIDQSVQAVKVTELRLDKQRDLFSSPFTVQLHKYDYDTLRYKNAFEFESWIIQQYGGIPQNKKGGDKGTDGKTADGVPIQVKRSDNIGVNIIKNFSVSAKQFDKVVFEKNQTNQNPVGYIIAFSFGKGAVQEVARLKLEENLIIRLVTVEEIVPIAKKPTLTVESKTVSQDEKGVWAIEFIATGQSEAGIEFYSWDFNHNSEQGFKADVMIDKTGKQTAKFKAGLHNIAVKVVDNDGLESVEVIKLKVNGMVERT
jgi:DNA modification methylase